MNKSRLMIAMLFAVAGVAVTTAARAEFKAELNSKVEAKNVTQIGIAALGTGSTVQNNVGGIATNGVKNANLKLKTEVKTGSITQIGIGVYGTSMQSNVGAVTVNAK
jgi:hypothetical protein